MTRSQALRLAEKHQRPIVVPNEWGRFDYALPSGITAHADTKDEALADLAARGFTGYFLVRPEYLTPCVLPSPETHHQQERRAA